MISYDDVRELQQFVSGPDSLVLSLYVNIDQSRAANLNRGFETAVANFFRQMIETQISTENNRQKFESENRASPALFEKLHSKRERAGHILRFVERFLVATRSTGRASDPGAVVAQSLGTAIA